MGVNNLLAVEHIIPVANGGNKYNWDNFLLACTYCNSCKKDRNQGREGYFWPDRDVTMYKFTYSQKKGVIPHPELTEKEREIALATINLTSLNRFVDSRNRIDARWKSRNEVWGIAKVSLQNWKLLGSDQMLSQICLTAKSSGHFSIWMEVFKNEALVKEGIIKQFAGTNLPRASKEDMPSLKPGGPDG